MEIKKTEKAKNCAHGKWGQFFHRIFPSAKACTDRNIRSVPLWMTLKPTINIRKSFLSAFCTLLHKLNYFL